MSVKNNNLYNKENIFYKIIHGQIKSNKLYEDQELIAIQDLYPVAPIHFLVLPKDTYIDFEDFVKNATPELISHYYKMIQILANKCGATEYRVLTNKGTSAGQTITHFHTHVIGGKKLGALIGN
ncbi:HIT family protein [Rickettsia endosymbiont of Cardiosporidium cionae]|uniref:HIT family protein n=1 Tax=Rickettsia endosymbiont of Cardiosporidium cionae TaxID=2777155 RepID=UPI001893290C|nr:HIT family protein [Rickettsia endosymbiont of Cardiosporidium cionae]KAF8818605.1 HIT domain-containing protein [Rickettsia endosymbiont of Cardiosporidium cionae]